MGEPITELELKAFTYIPSGNVDYPQVQTNFSEIEEKINEIIQEMGRMEDRKNTTVRSVLIAEGKQERLMIAKDHRHSKLKAAWVIAADNLEIDQTIYLKVKGKNIADPKELKATEKAGKTQSLELNPFYIINRYEDVDVIPTSTRKVIVTAIVEEV